jgi:hypothetical protein
MAMSKARERKWQPRHETSNLGRLNTDWRQCPGIEHSSMKRYLRRILIGSNKRIARRTATAQAGTQAVTRCR